MKEVLTSGKSLTPLWDKAVSEATNNVAAGAEASTAWAAEVWKRVREPLGLLVGYELLRFIRVPKTGRRFGRGMMRPRIA